MKRRKAVFGRSVGEEDEMLEFLMSVESVVEACPVLVRSKRFSIIQTFIAVFKCK
jgi:hypothetical protein